MSIVEEIKKEKNKLERIKENVLRSEGRVSQLMEQLKNRFDCESIQLAKNLLKLKLKKIEELKKKQEEDFNNWVEKYAEEEEE